MGEITTQHYLVLSTILFFIGALGVLGRRGAITVLMSIELMLNAVNLVFVAGSLAAIGGHNLIEPALLEKPILFGPHMKNFQEIAKSFLTHHAAIQVQDADELAEKMLMLLADGESRARLSREARRLALASQGAGRKTVRAIQAGLREKAE